MTGSTGLLCISLDHTKAGTEERAAAWSTESELRFFKNRGLILEGLLLRTCNRSELYLRLPPGGNVPSELMHLKARIYSGAELVLHLLRVLLGLESLACGESHISSQVKSCYSDSADICGPWLHRLFQSSLKMAKLLRSCYHPGMEPSMARLMVDKLLSYTDSKELSVLIIGAGSMGEETGRILLTSSAKEGLSAIGSIALTNRSAERAHEMKKNLLVRKDRESFKTSIREIKWERWREEAHSFDALFFCTGSPLPLFSMNEAGDEQYIFDMGSPPQVTASDKISKERLFSIDDLAGTAEQITASYRKKLGRLEAEAANAAISIMSELETLHGETYKRLVLHRAERIVTERAELTAKRTGADEEILRSMGWSIVKAMLSPAFAESNSHTRRLWKILAGELNETDYEQ